MKKCKPTSSCQSSDSAEPSLLSRLLRKPFYKAWTPGSEAKEIFIKPLTLPGLLNQLLQLFISCWVMVGEAQIWRHCPMSIAPRSTGDQWHSTDTINWCPGWPRDQLASRGAMQLAQQLSPALLLTSPAKAASAGSGGQGLGGVDASPSPAWQPQLCSGICHFAAARSSTLSCLFPVGTWLQLTLSILFSTEERTSLF